MKKFAFCALIVFAIVGFSFKYGADSRISEDSELRSVTQAAFSLRNTQTSDATAFLLGIFSGDNGTKLSSGGDGTLVLRVRNCDEVVYVPPIPDRSNPQTGDNLFRFYSRIFPGK